MRALKFITTAASLLGLSFSIVVQATTVARMSDRELTQQADIIVVGRCRHVESAWIGRELMTVATVELKQIYKGQVAKTIQVITPGGVDISRSPAIARVYPGAPQLLMSQDVFLFLDSEQRVPDTYGVVGYNQGMFEIVRSKAGQRLVTRDLRGVKLDSGNGGQPGLLQSVPLAQFTDAITSYLRYAP